MRKYTRFLALLLALAMILSCSTSAFAENAGSADEYYRFIHEYLNEQRRLENWTPEIFLSEQAVVSEGFTRPAPFMPPVSAPVSTFALARMSANDYGIALIDEDAEDPDGNSLVTSKTTTKNTGDGYKVRIEAFATGTTTTIQQSKPIPTDIVLVLDQSGSMADGFTVKIAKGYHELEKSLTNSDYWKRINVNNQTVWHKISDQVWVQVQMEKVYTGNPEYKQIQKPSYMQENGTYRNQLMNLADSGELYYLVNESYYPVVIDSYTSWMGTTYYNYSYMDGDTEHKIQSDVVWYEIPNATFYQNIQPYTYRYFYTVDTNENGQYDAGVDEKVVIIESSSGDTTTPLTADSEYSFYYYQATDTTNTISRREALVDAVTLFADQVAAKAETDKVNHRLAIVGFGSSDENTEVLTVKNNKGTTGVAYAESGTTITNAYKNAFQFMNTESGKSMVDDAIDALAESGATRTDLGMKMATHILDPDNDPYEPAAGEVRNKVVIMFTDGTPTTNTSFNENVANNTIGYAKSLKDGTITGGSVTVYTVGIFNGAEVKTPVTTNNLPDYNSNGSNRENRFMQLVSSNYLKAETMEKTGNEVNPNIGTGSYYLPASNTSELNDIFTSISSNIQSGSTSVTLDATSKVQDIVSDFFVPIKGNKTNVTVKTADYNGMVDGVRQWKPEQVASGVTPTVEGNNVSVTGFNFKEKYVATVNNAHQGQKLIIEFDIKPATGFLGGNNVPTNGSASGIYDKSGAKAELFDIPKVNVPIVMPTVSLTDKNVYLLDDLTMAQLYPAGAIDVKDANGKSVTLDYTKTNGGLEEWQMAYATLGIALSHQNGMSDLTSDTEFEASVTITPKPIADGEELSNQGQAATEQKASDKKTVYVFKPELTFKDSAENYLAEMDEATETDYYGVNNLVSTVWKHGTTLDSTVTMTGDEPLLSLTYNPDDGWINEAKKVSSTSDVPVNVTVAIGKQDIGQHTTSIRQACTTCDFESANSNVQSNDTVEFIVHIKNVYGNLIVEKTGLKTGESAILNVEAFVADGTTGGTKKTWQVVLTGDSEGKASVTLTGLLVGSDYTVSENNNWTWSYVDNIENRTGKINALTAETAKALLNNSKNEQWLYDESITQNVFDGNANN